MYNMQTSCMKQSKFPSRRNPCK